jgi:hypothetical protein
MSSISHPTSSASISTPTSTPTPIHSHSYSHDQQQQSSPQIRTPTKQIILPRIRRAQTSISSRTTTTATTESPFSTIMRSSSSSLSYSSSPASTATFSPPSDPATSVYSGYPALTYSPSSSASASSPLGPKSKSRPAAPATRVAISSPHRQLVARVQSLAARLAETTLEVSEIVAWNRRLDVLETVEDGVDLTVRPKGEEKQWVCRGCESRKVMGEEGNERESVEKQSKSGEESRKEQDTASEILGLKNKLEKMVEEFRDRQEENRVCFPSYQPRFLLTKKLCSIFSQLYYIKL